jgi:hypothetical protein
MKNPLRGAAAAFVLLCSPAVAQTAPDWDGLVRVDSRRFSAAYLAPGADFSGFTKVMLDPTEVAFRQNWQRDFNRSTSGVSNRITDQEARNILETVQAGFEAEFSAAYAAAGFQVVTTPAPDVLRVRTAVLNLAITAPDRMSPGRTSTFSRDAGQATMVVEARDSMSGALLGRAVDARAVGDRAFTMRRTRGTNRADFRRQFRSWADMSAQALNGLRETPPIPAAGAEGQP